MTEHKFTDEEVIKALETAIKIGDAPIGEHWACTISKKTAKDALDLIKRQKAEIKSLEDTLLGKLSASADIAVKDMDRKGKEMVQAMTCKVKPEAPGFEKFCLDGEARYRIVATVKARRAFLSFFGIETRAGVLVVSEDMVYDIKDEEVEEDGNVQRLRTLLGL